MSLGDFERWEVGAVRVGGDLSDSAQSRNGSVADGSCFGVGDSLGSLDQTGQETREERSDSVFRVDQFRHVVGNDADFSLGGGGSLVETSDEQRGDERDCRCGHFGDERGGREERDGFGYLLDGVEQGFDEGGDEFLNLRGSAESA